MASTARQLSRATLRAATRCKTVTTPRRTFQSYQPAPFSAYRSYSSPPPPGAAPSKPSAARIPTWVWGLFAIGGVSLAFVDWHGDKSPKAAFVPTKEDFEKVYKEIATLLEDKDDYDDGSYGPVLLRLAWHASGTFDKETGTGGSNGATMRFSPESDHGANSGLKAARDFLEPVKKKFPWITYSDLWILGGVCAIQEMQGPMIPFRPGRQDRDVAYCTPDGRLPDAAKGQRHLRDIFSRMGFSDQEIVALAGAHALGRCHTDRSGYSGPWTFSPTVLTNDYFKLLAEEKWQWKKWDGPAQYEDKKTQSLMMLPADMALVQDKSFKQHVEKYAKDNEAFFKEFSAVIVKLFELGVPFSAGSENDRWMFKPLSTA